MTSLAMPGLDGLSATRRIAQAAPDTRILLLTMAHDDTSPFAALKAGAHGYLREVIDADELAVAIRAAAAGEAVFGAGVATRPGLLRHPRPTQPAAGLTDRKCDVLDLVAASSATKASRRLSISPKTVRNHVTNVIAKLHVADRGEAVSGRAMVGERARG